MNWKLILIISLITCLVLGAWAFVTRPKIKIISDTALYRNTEMGIEFTYPKILTVDATGTAISLFHDIPYQHEDFCPATKNISILERMTDFHMEIHIDDSNLVDTMKTESPYIPEENFVNGEVVESPGFIDSFSQGNLKGFRIFEGAEGCGQTIYYFPISKTKTLVITRELISVFSGVVNERYKTEALAVPGVISKEDADKLFDTIVKTIKFN